MPEKPEHPPAGGSGVTPPRWSDPYSIAGPSELAGVTPPPDPPPQKLEGFASPAPPERTPFNSTPTTAPVTAPEDAGAIETKLMADLAMLQAQRGSPVASTLSQMALTLARHADTDGGSVREQIATMKELRALLDDITKEAGTTSHDPDDTSPDSPFGAVRPELVDT